MEIKIKKKLGRLANGFESDKGSIWHALPVNANGYTEHKALCGTEPGRRSVGWSFDDGAEVTCQRCARKLQAP